VNAVSSLVTGCRRDLYPSLQSNLAEFRQHLVDSMADMAPLKVWQLQGTHVFVHAWISGYLLSPKVMCTYTLYTPFCAMAMHKQSHI